jgi:VanZ family protein
MRFFIIMSARTGAWLLAVAIIVLSFVPPSLRPETDLPHDLEHFAIFVATGVAFGVGYSRRPGLVSVWLVIFAGAIEFAQILVPGRHARLSDFVVDALAAWIGAATASLVAAQTLEESFVKSR